MPDLNDLNDMKRAGVKIPFHGEPIPTPRSGDTHSAAENVGGNGSPDRGETAECTDLSNAERLVQDHGRDLLSCAGFKEWHAWDGRRWSLDETGEVSRRAKDVSRHLRSEASAELKSAQDALQVAKQSNDSKAKAMAEAKLARVTRLFKWAKTSQSVIRLGAMINLSATEPGIPRVIDDLDADPWALNAANRTVDLRTGQLRTHRREDLLTKLAGVTCSPDAPLAPLWDAFLERIFDGDEELIAFVQRFLGYALTGSPTEEVLAVFWGSGANGKSTLISTVAHVLGDYYRQLDPDVLLMNRGGNSSKVDSEKAALKGVRLAACSETSQLRTVNEGQLKQLASTDRIVGKRLYADPFDFTPTHQLIMVTNHRPAIRTTDIGTWRRILLVPFTVTIPEEERDIELASRLRAEGPAILRWLIDGCLEWQRRGLCACEAVLSATKEYRQDQDELGDFLNEHTVSAQSARCKASELYKTYKDWCEAGGAGRVISQTAFGEAMTERGFQRHKIGIKWYLGLGLVTKRSDADNDTAGDDDWQGQGELCH